MSREIDERVVQMKFEKGQFEKDIQTSIHNLDELKKGLDFKDATKGFAELDRAARNTDMSALAKAIDNIHLKFNLLDVFALNVMNRISNAIIGAANSAKQLVTSLTIDQITPGWDKYAQKTSSVQTIMAATAAQFSDTATQMEVVNEQLNKLNWFTDETSYNFVDMVNNIGKFTSNNIALDQSVTAMQGIANWAAISGANAQEASRAMYNLAQALATGTVKLIDWKSIENANMATTEFKQTVIDIATEMGTLKKVGEDLWTTLDGKTQVSVSNFNEGLSKGWFTNDVLMKGLNKYGAASEKLNEIYEKLGSNVTTSRIVSSVEDYIDALSNARAEAQKLELDVEKTNEKVAEAGKQVAKEVASSWGVSLEEATEMLAQFDNETMQFGLKAFKAAQEAKTFQEAIDSVKDAVSTGWMKTFETLFGPYTEAKELWTNLANTMYDVFAAGGDIRNEMLSEWAEQGGRKYFTDTIYASLAAILSIMAPIKAAWEAVFGSMTAERLLDITKRLHTFVLSLIQTEESAQKIARVFRGLFSVLDIIKVVLTRVVKGGFGVLQRVLNELNIDMGEFVASLGDGLYQIRNWVKETDFISTIFEKIGDALVYVIRQSKEFIAKIKEFGPVKALIDGLNSTFTGEFKGIGGVLEAVGNILSWLWNKFKAFKLPTNLNDILEFFKQFGEEVFNNFQSIGINLTWLKDLFSNFSDSVKSALQSVNKAFAASTNVVGGALGYLIAVFKSVDWSGVILAAFGVGTLAILWKYADALTQFAKAFQNVTGVGKSAQGALNAIRDYFKALKENIQVNNILKLAIAITGLSVAFGLLSKLTWAEVKNGAWAIGSIAAALGALSLVLTALNKLGFSATGLSSFLLSIGTALLLLSVSLNAIPVGGDLNKRIGALFEVVLTLALGVALISQFTKNANAQIKGVISFAASILLLVAAIKLIGGQDIGGILLATPVVLALMATLGFMMKLITEANLFGSGTKGVKMFTSSIGIVIGIMGLISVIKKLGEMDFNTAAKGIYLCIPVILLLELLFMTTDKVGQHATRAGKMLLYISLALALLIPVIKGFADIPFGSLIKGGATIVALTSLVMKPLIELSKYSGQYSAKAGLMILEIAGALAILQLVVKTLGNVDLVTLAKGVISVSALILALSVTVKSLNGLGEANESNVKVMTKLVIIVGILSTLILLLSMINPTGALVASVGISAVLLSLGIMLKNINGIELPPFADIGMITLLVSALAAVIGIMGAITDWKGALAVAGGMSAIILALAATTQIIKNSATSKALKEKLETLSWFAKKMIVIMGALTILTGLAQMTGLDPKAILIVTTAMSELMIAMGIMGKLMGKMSVGTSRQFDDMIAFIGQMAFIVGIVASIIGLVNSKNGGIDLTGLLTFITGMSEIMIAMGIAMRLMSGTEFNKDTTANIIALGVMVTIMGTVLGLIATIMTSAGVDMVKMIEFASGISLVVVAFGLAARIMGKTDFKLGLVSAAAMSLLIASIGLTLGLLSGMSDPAKVLPMALGISVVLLALSAAAMILAKFPSGGIAGALEGIVVAGAILLGITGLMAIIGLFAKDDEKFATAADVLVQIGRGIGGFIGGIVGGLIEGVSSAFPGVCSNISEGMGNLMPFFDYLHQLPLGVVELVGTLLAIVAGLTAAQFISGLKSLPGIGKLMALGSVTLVSDFALFGRAIKAFSDEVEGVDGQNVKNAADALVALASVEKNMGGIKGLFNSLIDKIFGSDNLKAFGERLKALGECVKAFAEETKGITGDSVKEAANVTQTLMQLEKGLPPKNGLLQAFLGSDGFDKFGERLGQLADALVTFSTKGTLINMEGMSTARDTAKELVDLEGDLAPVSGLTGFIFGEKALDGFGERITSFGSALVSFSTAVTGNVSTTGIHNAVVAASELIALEEQIDNSGGVSGFFFGNNDLGSFGKSLNTFGSALVDFNSNISGVNFAQLNSAVDYIKELLGLPNIDKAKRDALTSVKDILKALHEAISNDYDVMKNYGESDIMWLAKGMTNGSTKYGADVQAAAITLADQFIEAFEAALGIASPSVVMMEEGVWVVKGLAEGITNETSAEEAAQKKAQNLVAAFDSELSKLTNREKTSDLEFQLWKLTDGTNASEVEIAQKQLEIENEKLADLAKMVSARKVAMENIAKIAGEDSAEYQSAYQTYLQAQIDMLNQQKSIEETYYSSTSTMLTDPRDQATAFANFMKDNAQAYEFLGKSQDELEAAAYKAAYGLDAEAVARKKQYEQIMSEYSQSFEYLGKTKEELDAFAKQQSGWEGMSVNAANAMSETAQIIKDNIEYYSLDLETTLDMAMAEVLTNSTKRGSSSSSAAASVGSNLGDTIGGNLIDKVTEAISGGENEENGIFAGLLNMEKWDEILSDTGIIDWFGQKASGLSSLFGSEFITNLGEQAKPIADGLYEMVQNGIDMSGIQDLVNTFGKDATLGVANGIKDEETKKDLVDAINEAIVDTTKDTITGEKGLDINSPSKVTQEYGAAVNEGFADGILENMSVVENAVKDLVATMKGALDEMPEIGTGTMQGYVNGLNNVAITNEISVIASKNANNAKTPFLTIVPDFKQIGINAMTGFKDGLNQEGSKAIKAAQDIAKQVAASMADALKVKSPSRVTMEIGHYVGIGLANGISESSSAVSNAVEEMADNTIDSLSYAAQAIDNIINSDEDFRPVITPVLDMDQLKKQASGISSILNTDRTINIDSARLRVGQINTSRTNANGQNGSTDAVNQTNYNFVQNNYSPKALSRAEIYRQTNNQFSRIKGATKR